jgi:NAD(P)-dependent dehydrogenase (short-subunit alcohol dehydrogenase family)
MDLKLEGRSALITGASRGIGLAIAKLLASEGVALCLAARDGDRLSAVAQEIERHSGVPVKALPADLSQSDKITELVERCGDVDILVNNAGAIPRGTLEEIDGPTWRRAWDLKVFGYVDLTRAYYSRMRRRKSGVIVSVIGAAADRPDPNYVAGCMGNVALNMLTQCIGGESVRHGVRVVAVNPGPIMTDRFMEGMYWRAEKRFGDRERWPEILASDLPIKRAGTVEEVASVVAFLASDHASYISGAAIRIDAGFLGAMRTSN